MFSMCSELTPRAPILDSRIAQFMQPCVQIGWLTGALCCQITSRSKRAEGTHRVLEGGCPYGRDQVEHSSSLVFGQVGLNEIFPSKPLTKDYPCCEADGDGDKIPGSQNANNRVPMTNSQPVLVLMEFMENGDLHSFLKKRRQV